ncbi:YkvR family protein [Bacillus carboniphilus]|uniref:YkvR family protein n=1 Tax=Bacillus carboniphilus TaxID=86663 RepID=A0ABN0W6X8_9BACI
MEIIIINDVSIEATNYKEERVGDKGRMKISFDFKVEHLRYHEITTMLYANNFKVKIPKKNLDFEAEISSYSTSVTNLYEVGAVGDFALSLIEKEKDEHTGSKP